jgi:hypothetical protein
MERKRDCGVLQDSTNPVGHIAGVCHASYIAGYRALLLVLHDKIDEVDSKFCC